jgi:plasmid stabilization system protein ParE
MKHKIFQTALNAIIEIWHYTDKHWGDDQADKYIRAYGDALNLLTYRYQVLLF